MDEIPKASASKRATRMPLRLATLDLWLAMDVLAFLKGLYDLILYPFYNRSILSLFGFYENMSSKITTVGKSRVLLKSTLH